MHQTEMIELKKYRRAIEKTIKEHHAANHPVYHCKDGYIVAIYPGGREAKIQKVKNS
ncbi:MAG: hypothetical protein JSS34_08370 [Proteobacteria bacterium]|nr:hypothetical protein [Pseudomonadota bacterium]